MQTGAMPIISVRATLLKLILIVYTAAEQSEGYEKQSAMKMLLEYIATYIIYS